MRIPIVLALLAGSAHAGDICATDDRGNADPKVELRALETFAKTKQPDVNVDYIEYCLNGDVAHKARILAACTTVLDRDPKYDACYVVAASLGTAMLGSHDIYAWVANHTLDPWNMNSSLPDYPMYLFRALGDPRAAKLVVGKWTALIPIEAKHEKSAGWMQDWSGWRQHAAEALATTGSADDATFLTDQAALTKDIHVREACSLAAAAIKRRASP